MGIKILHCADLHIGASLSSLGFSAEKRGAEILRTLGSIVNCCKENSVRLLIIAGDLFDSNHINSQTLTAVFDYFASIPETVVAVTPGNHDFLSADSPYAESFPENVHIFKEAGSIEVDGVTVHGIPFLSAYSEGFNLPKAENGVNILIMHGDLSGGPYNPLTEAALAESGMDYIALGHVHKYSGINRADKTYWAYPGCPEPLGFDELGEKGVIIGTVSENECSLEFMPLSAREYKEIYLDISDFTEQNEVLSAARALLEKERNHLIKLILSGENDLILDTAFLQTALENECFYLKVRNRTHEKINLEVLKNEQSLKGIFVKKMLDLYDKADDAEKEKILSSMYLALAAFDRREVSFDEN